jgi:argininosuccinate synthase
MSDIKKVVLAYSGGLDTSVILKWLQDTYQCEVVTFTADLGQGEELEPARAKALQFGIKPENIFIDDLREEFVRDFVFPMFRCNTVYEGEYLLGTSIARPLIAKRLIDIVNATGADAISHGATGKGNDQVRFELGAYALKPGIKVIAPWREWDLLSREKLMAYAEEHGIPVDMKHKQGGSPYSMDANLLHISYEGRHLEDPAAEAEESMWRWTVSPEAAPDKAEYLDIEYEKGDIVGLNGTRMSPASVLATLNKMGGKHGIGRLDLVENRYVGMKSRGCYETPGGTIMLRAHRAIESVCLDREVAHLKDDLMPRYASLVYNGYWWSPERIAADADRPHAKRRQRLRPRQAVQGQRHRCRPRFQDRFAVRPDHRHLRGRCRRLRSEGCRRFHQAQRPAHAHCRQPARQARARPKRWNPTPCSVLPRSRLADFGSTWGVGAFILFMLFIIGEIAWKSKAGKTGTIVLFLCSGLRHGRLSLPRQSFRKFGEFKCRNTTMFPWSRANVYFDGKCVSHTVVRRWHEEDCRRHPSIVADLQYRRAGGDGRRRRFVPRQAQGRVGMEDLRRWPVF